MNLFEWAARLIGCRREEHWDPRSCAAERHASGLRLNLLGARQEEVLEVHGEPTLIEALPMQRESERNVISETERRLVYDQLLNRSRVIFHIVEGSVHGITFMPKSKRFRPARQQAAAGQLGRRGSGQAQRTEKSG